MLTLTLVRHGQTTENLEGILQGQSPGHLNSTGIEQAQALRDTLSASDYDLILCSDLLRTRLTAQILNEQMQLPIAYTPLLRERDWGEFTGRPIKTITMHPSEFPPSIENAEQLADRAEQFIAHILDQYDGQRILAVGHGYFNRCIQAVIEQRTVHDTPRWENTELRTFQISTQTRHLKGPTDFIVSEN